MRRKDREVTEFKDIVEIIRKCQVIRLGLSDEDGFPYIVPLNFGYQVGDGELDFFIHGAMAGRKYDLLKKNGRCSFELDNPLGLEILYDSRDVTMRYESVMGKAEVSAVEDLEEKVRIMDMMMDKEEMTKAFDYGKSALPRTAVFRLHVTEMVGKRNPFSGNAD